MPHLEDERSSHRWNCRQNTVHPATGLPHRTFCTPLSPALDPSSAPKRPRFDHFSFTALHARSASMFERTTYARRFNTNRTKYAKHQRTME